MPHGPFRVSLKRVPPIQVRAHARHHVHAAFAGRRHALAEKIAAIEEFSVA